MVKEVNNKFIYISVCYDRHTDDKISAYRTKESAMKMCDTFMSGYIGYGEVIVSDNISIYSLRFEMDESPRAYAERISLVD